MNPLAPRFAPSRQTSEFSLAGVFYTTDYGVVADNNPATAPANDAALTLALIDVVAFGGGILQLPPGTIYVSQPIVLQQQVILRGSGFNTTIKPVSGSNGDVICTPLPQSQGQSGFIQYYVGVENLTIDGSLMSGTTTGQGNLIHFYGTRFSWIRNCQLLSAKNWSILLDGDNTGPGNNFAYNNVVDQCVFDLGNANVWCTNSEANEILGCKFKYAGASTVAAQPLFGTQDSNTYHVRCSSGYGTVSDCVLGSGGSYTADAIIIANSGPWRIVNNRFDQTRQQAIRCNSSGAVIANNVFTSCSKIGTNEVVRLGNTNITVVGNRFDTTAGGPHYTYCVAEGGGPWSNTIVGNMFVAGTSGVLNLNATSTDIVVGNDGYNPRGFITAPGMPASTVAQTNNSSGWATIYISGGTVTVIKVNSTTTGLTSGTFRVGPGETITITYSVAPSWVWYID